MKKDSDYDLLVIGSGPAGQRGAIQAAKLGKRVALIEKKEAIGGVSVHSGTIPSKTLREVALYLSGYRQRAFYGQGYRLRDSLSVRDLTQRLSMTLQREIDVMTDQLRRNRVEVIRGLASFVDPHRLLVERRNAADLEISADNILIATGTKPYRPPTVPFDGKTVIDSDELLDIDDLPRTMTVVGAGVIGLEYASIFSSIDIKVTLLDRRETMLDFVDQEIVQTLVHDLRERGVHIRLGEEVDVIERLDNGQTLTRLKSGREVRSDLVMYAAGRCGNTSALYLDNAGLEADARGRIKVDDEYRTAQRHIFAAGDVIGFPSLASASMEQGRLASCHAFGVPAKSCPTLFPFGIYAVPEISMVGATEQALRDQGVRYEVGVARLRETARGQILGLRTGVLKLLVGLDDHKVLGVHILGEGATELIHIGQAALALGGTLSYFVDSVFNYPTLAEAYKVAALDAHNRMPRRRSVAANDSVEAPASIEANADAAAESDTAAAG